MKFQNDYLRIRKYKNFPISIKKSSPRIDKMERDQEGQISLKEPRNLLF